MGVFSCCKSSICGWGRSKGSPRAPLGHLVWSLHSSWPHSTIFTLKKSILPCPWLPGCPPGLPQGSPSASTKVPPSAPFCSESRQGAMHARNVEHSMKIKVFKGHARYVRGPRTSETRNIRQKSMFSRATHVFVRGPRTSETRNSRQKSTIPGLLIIILFKRPGTRRNRAEAPPETQIRTYTHPLLEF